jgi:hypothetical protein
MFRRTLVGAAAFIGLLALNTAMAVAGEKGPRGGHVVDVDRYHLELVADGQELRLFLSDTKDRAIPAAGASAKATVISAGGKSTVELKPAGENVLKGSGTFARSQTMKVDVVLSLPGSPAPIVAKFQPLAASGSHKHDHKH